MWIWLIAVAVLAILWAGMWKNLPNMALGVLIGLPIGWLASRSIQSYLAGDMHEIPIWLPPLPFALVATLLIVVGLVIFLRAGNEPSSSERSHEESSH
jgi:hypothetical protein